MVSIALCNGVPLLLFVGHEQVLLRQFVNAMLSIQAAIVGVRISNILQPMPKVSSR